IVDGTELTNDLKKIDEFRREVGMVFQHFNLFPHLTILENFTLAPIWVRNMPKNSAGELCSTIWPWYMKMTRLATWRAKPISCVTKSMVMPSS
ncbi:hypothetical protein ACCS53_37725, partial [Rhizobium ruizarguesonis]